MRAVASAERRAGDASPNRCHGFQASMNGAHLHLIITHVPVVGSAFGLILLFWGMARGSVEIKRAALGALVLSALLALPAFFSGEPATAKVTSQSGVLRETIEQHQDLALAALIVTEVAGATSLVGLLFFRSPKPLPKWFTGVLVIVVLASATLLAWTSNLGGRIRHPEIREGTTTQLHQR